ncbi:MAG: hypothetical protein ACM3O3_12400 [Syntrophothermus sp.]
MKLEVIGNNKLITGENKEKNLYFFKLVPEELNQIKNVSHHILLCDVSGSMYNNIRTLKSKVNTTLETLLQIENSYVSVITYSGHNQSEIILSCVKCDEISYQMSKVYHIIDSELYTKGVTVISEPLEKSIQICKSLAHICNKHHIALFTDGCLVPWNWSETVEENKCFEVAKICSNEGIFLNTIGFGQYYDRQFLNKLINIAGNGQVIHIDSVEDYFDVIINAIKKVNNENVEIAHLEVTNGFIFNIKTSQLNHEMNVNVDSKFIFATSEVDAILIDGVLYHFDNYLQTCSSELLKQYEYDFYYSLARHYLKEEDIDNYEYIVNYLGDTHLFEQTQNCYSFLEKGNAINKVTVCLETPALRFIKGKNQILTNSINEPLCLLEALQMIIEDEQSCLYFDLNTPYHRITQASKLTEDSIKFEKTEAGLVNVTSISVGSEKLNIGIKVRIDGTVKDEISGYSKKACIYRDFNLLNGGNVNVPYIYAKLSPHLYFKFLNEGLISKTEPYAHETIDGCPIYKLDLTYVKSVNKRMLKLMNMSDIQNTLLEIAHLKCEQWAYNKMMKEILGDKEKIDMLGLSFEEQEINKLLRIDENGIYQPLKVEKDNESAFEVYPATHITWKLAQFNDKKEKEQYLSSLKQLIKTKKYDDKDIYDYCSQYLTGVRNELRQKEFKINCVRIASAMMNKSPFIWDVELEKAKTSNDKILKRNMVIGGKINVSKKTVNDCIIEQKRWTQLVKCN